MSKKIKVTKRASVIDRGVTVYETGQVSYYGNNKLKPHEIAAHYTAIADHIDAEQETAAAAKLAERRDALAREITGHGYTYLGLGRWTQAAIDRILELQDKLVVKP